MKTQILLRLTKGESVRTTLQELRTAGVRFISNSRWSLPDGTEVRVTHAVKRMGAPDLWDAVPVYKHL